MRQAQNQRRGSGRWDARCGCGCRDLAFSVTVATSAPTKIVKDNPSRTSPAAKSGDTRWPNIGCSTLSERRSGPATQTFGAGGCSIAGHNDHGRSRCLACPPAVLRSADRFRPASNLPARTAFSRPYRRSPGEPWGRRSAGKPGPAARPAGDHWLLDNLLRSRKAPQTCDRLSGLRPVPALQSPRDRQKPSGVLWPALRWPPVSARSRRLSAQDVMADSSIFNFPAG